VGLYLCPYLEEVPLPLRSGRRYLYGEIHEDEYFVKREVPIISKRKIMMMKKNISASWPLDGRGIIVYGYEDGNFLGPTIVNLGYTNAASDSNIVNDYQSSIFGRNIWSSINNPICPNIEDAIAITNSNRYGNGAAIFTSSGGAA
jgi:hypothetical protein